MRRPCPVCGSIGRRSTVHRQRFVDGPLGKGYDVVLCVKCGAGFADGIPTQAKLDRYYAEQSKYEYSQSGGEESPYDFLRFEAIVDQLVPYIPRRDASILDVGCATGGLLACWARRGYKNLLGSDPSPACAKSAQRLHRIKVLPGSIAQLASSKRHYDLILLVGVLEHLRDVQLAIDVLAKLLNRNGLIYCAQPDVQAFPNCINAPYQQFSTEHLNFFTRNSINNLMRGRGFVPLKNWRWMVEWRESVTDSVISGLFAKSMTSDSGRILAPDRVTGMALNKYLNLCERAEKRLIEDIATLVRTQEPILIWATGTFTRRLLATTLLSKANIVAFVDSNPHIQGDVLVGRPILRPEEVAVRSECIVICSAAFGKEIKATIRNQYKFTNRIRSLLREKA